MKTKRGRYTKYRADSKIVVAARELYLKYGGQQHVRIEREMKAAGFNFYRNRLYTRRHSSGTVVGWPERFGWERAISDQLLAVREEQDGRATTPSDEASATPPRQGGELRIGPSDEASATPRRKGGEFLKRRRNAGRNAFERWLCESSPEFRWRWNFQRYIYQKLAAVTSGKCKRLMISMPPRHGKSEMVTIRYIAWRLICEQKLNVIIGSYNQRLADRFSRRIKRMVQFEEQLRVEEESGKWRVEEARSKGVEEAGKMPAVQKRAVQKRLNSASEWETAGGGVVRSVGVGAGIAGFGAGLIVIDDPVKNRADAESKNNREKVDDWFKNDIYTRLEPDASIILITTRWHEDDLAGRLLKEAEDGGEEWEVVCLAAIAEDWNAGISAGVWQAGMPALQRSGGDVESRSGGEKEMGSGGEEEERSGKKRTVSRSVADPLLLNSSTPQLDASSSPRLDALGRKAGEALCPERYDVKALRRIRKKLGNYAFSALYQQRPEPLEGGQFKRAWFSKIIDYVPPGLRWKRGYDLAVSTKTTADYTASFRVATDKAGNLYIADGFRKRIEYPEQRRYIIERMKAEEATEHGIESALHGKAVVQELRNERELRRYALREVRVTNDKLTRALAWLNLAEEGKVILIRGPWINDFIDEVAAFPTGRYDDQVDAVSVAVNMLAIGGTGKKFFLFS